MCRADQEPRRGINAKDFVRMPVRVLGDAPDSKLDLRFVIACLNDDVSEKRRLFAEKLNNLSSEPTTPELKPRQILWGKKGRNVAMSGF